MPASQAQLLRDRHNTAPAHPVTPEGAEADLGPQPCEAGVGGSGSSRLRRGPGERRAPEGKRVPQPSP